MRTGHQETAKATLIAALTRTADPAILNEGADELAEGSLALDIAESSARKAIEMLTPESAGWVMTDIPNEQKGRQILMVSTWDTLGWALAGQDKLEEAETWLQAAWLNESDPEIGFHLGRLQERQGRQQEAIETYRMALTELVSPKRPKEDAEAIRHKLQDRIDLLRQQEKKISHNDVQGEARVRLQHLRVLPLGAWKGPNLLKDFTFALHAGRIEEVVGTTAGQNTDPEDQKRVQKANLANWTPRNSEARIIKQGTLNCHGLVCELVIYPM
jgi:tetratricopeptide (TPR) repeat protein